MNITDITTCQIQITKKSEIASLQRAIRKASPLARISGPDLREFQGRYLEIFVWRLPKGDISITQDIENGDTKFYRFPTFV